ncbi:MAG: hypothetical protein AB8B62_11255 [Roseobacter sp.]
MTITTHSANAESVQNADSSDSDKNTPKTAAEEAAKVLDYAAEQKRQVGDTAEVTVREVRDSLIKVSDDARNFAAREPLATAAGALAIGVILGMAINKRR